MGNFDELLGDPEMRLVMLHELIEALQLHVEEDTDGIDGRSVEENSENLENDQVDGNDAPQSCLVHMATLVHIVETEYYCPTTMLLVLRAMNALLDIDPAFGLDASLSINVVETVLYAAMSMHDADITDYALKWCKAMARERPSWFLVTGGVYYFLTTQKMSSVGTKTKCLELALRALNVDPSKENASAILATADCVVEYLDDGDKTIGVLALEWTIVALNVMQEYTHLLAFVHNTGIVFAWTKCFPKVTTKMKCRLLQCFQSIASVCSRELVEMFAHLLYNQCFILRTENLNTYNIKAAALPTLAKLSSLQRSLPYRPPYVMEWSCAECTVVQSVSQSICQVCAAPRVPIVYELQQQEWLIRKLGYDHLVNDTQSIYPHESPTLAQEFAPSFISDVMYYLKNEACASALCCGLELLKSWIDPHDEDAWSNMIAFAGLLYSTMNYDEYISELVQKWETICKLDKAIWTQLLQRNGLANGSKSHPLFSLVNNLIEENDSIQHQKLYKSISTIEPPPTQWEIQESGWLEWISHHDVDLTSKLITSIDNQFVAEPLLSSIDAWEQTPLQLRLWLTCGNFVDVLAHPLLLIGQVVALVASTSSSKTDCKLPFSPDVSLATLIDESPVQKCSEDLLVLVEEVSISVAETVIGALVSLSCNSCIEYSKVYELHVTTNTINTSRKQSNHANAMPRLTQAFAHLTEDELRIATRSLPDITKLALSINPAGVPLELRRNFFLGSKTMRDTREKFGGRTSISVSRDKLHECIEWAKILPQRVLYVAFKDEAGHGIGPTTEFYTILSNSFLKTSLWRDPGSLLFPAPKGSTELFELLGRAFGRAFLDGYTMDMNFSNAMIKLLQRAPLLWSDVIEFDATLYQSLKCLEETENAEMFELYFNLPGEDNYNLIDNGCNRLVTNANRDEYIALVKQHFLHDSVRCQIDAFLRGFECYLPARIWQYFTSSEWQILLHRDMPWMDTDLESGLICRSGYTKSSPVIQWLIKILTNFDAVHRGLFLKFVTGSPCLPLGGWAELALTVVASTASDVALPSCNTCQKYLKLPKYSSSSVLQVKLIQAITEGQAHFALD